MLEAKKQKQKTKKIKSNTSCGQRGGEMCENAELRVPQVKSLILPNVLHDFDNLQSQHILAQVYSIKKTSRKVKLKRQAGNCDERSCHVLLPSPFLKMISLF